MRSMRTKSNRLEELFVRLTGLPDVAPGQDPAAPRAQGAQEPTA